MTKWIILTVMLWGVPDIGQADQIYPAASLGYSGLLKQEVGVGFILIGSSTSGAMAAPATAMRLKYVDFDRKLIGPAFDIGYAGLVNFYVGAAAYTNGNESPFHIHACYGIIANLCLRVGKDGDKRPIDLALELII